MVDIIPISDAKANLSKLVKRAHAGEVIYLGAYGRAEAILAPLPERPQIAIGVWKDRAVAGFAYDDESLVESDPESVAAFDESIERADPGE